MTGFDVAEIRRALARVHERIVAAGGHSSVRILPVTKGFGAGAIDAVLAAGATSIGENYAQELIAKRTSAERAEVHFIGQLQTNKVRQLADIVDVYETVDRIKLAREIAKRVPGAAVLIQVDSAAETGKGGCPIAELDQLVAQIGELELDLRGLMTVGPTVGGPEAAEPGFRAVRDAVDRLGLTICSMGMTDDLEVAVRCGTTQVRVGTALFGSRTVHTDDTLVR